MENGQQRGSGRQKIGGDEEQQRENNKGHHRDRKYLQPVTSLLTWLVSYQHSSSLKQWVAPHPCSRMVVEAVGVEPVLVRPMCVSSTVGVHNSGLLDF